MIDIPGYTCARLDRNWIENGRRKKGGGVCCYIRKEISFSGTEYENPNMSSKDIEICWISLNIPLCRKIVIGTVYRPPQGIVKKLCDTLEDHVEKIQNNSPMSTEIYILGDCNINYLAKNTHDMRELKWFEQKTSMLQCIKQITRFSNNNSCLDLIFTNSNFVAESGTLDVNLSDHEMIFVTRKQVKKQHTPTSFMGRSYLNFDEENFGNAMLALDWEPFYECVNPNLAWKVLNQNILSVIDRMCPKQEFKIKKFKDPWISQEILEAIRDKDVLLSTAKHSNKQEDWVLARQHRNEVKNLVKNAKSDFIKENLNEHQNDSKKFWKSLNTILPSGKSNNSNKIQLKDSNDQVIKDYKEAAGIMNKFFTSIGPSLAANLNDPWTYKGKIIEVNIPDLRTNEEEVLKLFKKININKSSAVPNLSSKILKPVCLALLDQFTFMFNLCTAPNTMICCTVYTKGVRKYNTSTYTNLSLKHCIVKCALYQHYAVFEY